MANAGGSLVAVGDRASITPGIDSEGSLAK